VNTKDGLVQGSEEVITQVVEMFFTIHFPQLRTINMDWALIWAPSPIKCRKYVGYANCIYKVGDI
jgi:hypothetical protein